MSWLNVAAIGSAVIGAVSSSRAADKGAEAIEKGQDILAQSREQARQDVLRLFPGAQQAQTQGFQQAQDFLAGQVLPQQAGLFQQGNVAAQQQIARGLPQIQSAILGLPTDLTGFQAQQFQLPQFNLAGLGGRQTTAQQPTTTPVVGGGAALPGSSFLPPGFGTNIASGIFSRPQNPSIKGNSPDRDAVGFVPAPRRLQ